MRLSFRLKPEATCFDERRQYNDFRRMLIRIEDRDQRFGMTDEGCGIRRGIAAPSSLNLRL
jgi:hypothetical protein